MKRKNRRVKNQNIFDYKMKAEKDAEQDLKLKHTPLDPNHTHFILVDNQDLNKFDSEIKFRNKLENAILEHKFSEDCKETDEENEENIPMVFLVFGGCTNALKTVEGAIHNGSPCIFFEVNFYDYQ